MVSSGKGRVRRPQPRRLGIFGRLAVAGLLGLVLLGAWMLPGCNRLRPSEFVPGASPSSGAGTSGAATEPYDRINILILGIDARQEGEQTRSDTMILLSLDPKTRDAAMLSIPRDSRVQIPGHGLDKITHAHAFGGVDLAVQTVVNNFGVPVHHWVRIDMPRFLKLIDVLGPVTVNVPYDLRLNDGRLLKAGPHQMDSQLVLAYLRERHHDPSGDFGRADRQQQFLLDVARQMKSNLSILDLPRVLSIVTQYVETDMGIRDAVALLRFAWGTDLDHVKRGMVKGRGVTINGIYYYEVDWAATNKVMADLGIKPQ